MGADIILVPHAVGMAVEQLLQQAVVAMVQIKILRVLQVQQIPAVVVGVVVIQVQVVLDKQAALALSSFATQTHLLLQQQQPAHVQ